MQVWLENMMKPGTHIIVDCGYVRHPNARRNAGRLFKLMGLKNTKGHCLIAGFGRLLVRIPPTKEKLLKRFKTITKRRKNGRGYCDTTYVYGNGPQFDLKYAM